MSLSAASLEFDSSAPSPRPKRRLTRVLIVSDHPTASRDVATNLRRLDLDVQLALFDGSTLTSIPVRAPDAVLCHLVDYAERGPEIAKVVRAHFNRHIPIIGALSRPIEGHSAEFDSTVFAPVHASQIASRVNSIIRLGVMEGEITRRLDTLRHDFGQAPKINDISPDRRFRVLFIGKASPAFMVVINALQDKGVEVVAAFTSFSAFDYLHGDPFDAVVMNAVEQSEPALTISQTMRRNARLYHVPTLFLVNGEDFRDHDAAYKNGARDIISLGAESDEISGRILELANYYRTHEQLKEDMFNLTCEDARDMAGHVFSRRFAMGHLPRMAADAQKAAAPLSLLRLDLSPNTTSEISREGIERALTQAAEMIGNLVRMQDVVARWRDNRLILAFYNTDHTEAEIIAARIETLTDNASFEISQHATSALTLEIETRICELKGDELTQIGARVLDLMA